MRLKKYIMLLMYSTVIQKVLHVFSFVLTKPCCDFFFNKSVDLEYFFYNLDLKNIK